MNELLRMANEIIAGKDDVVRVIEDYQELVRRMAEVLSACAAQIHSIDGWADTELRDRVNTIWAEASDSVPHGVDGVVYE